MPPVELLHMKAMVPVLMKLICACVCWQHTGFKLFELVENYGSMFYPYSVDDQLKLGSSAIHLPIGHWLVDISVC